MPHTRRTATYGNTFNMNNAYLSTARPRQQPAVQENLNVRSRARAHERANRRWRGEPEPQPSQQVSTSEDWLRFEEPYSGPWKSTPSLVEEPPVTNTDNALERHSEQPAEPPKISLPTDWIENQGYDTEEDPDPYDPPPRQIIPAGCLPEDLIDLEPLLPLEPEDQDLQDNQSTPPPLDSWRTTTTFPTARRDRRHLDRLTPRGVLVRDDPRYSMDDAATQQASLPPTDPYQKDGSHLSLSQEDRSDILCILSPGSQITCEAVKLVGSTTPQHLLQNRLPLQNASSRDDLIQNEDQPNEMTTKADPTAVDDKPITSDDVQTTGNDPPLDIALRMSSKLLNPCFGFTFGRNPAKSDLLLCTKQQQMRISGSHFRIFITSGGVLMCEDTSTNGTWVDEHIIMQKPTRPGVYSKRSLHNGSIIALKLDLGEPMRFWVRVLDREDVSNLYGRNLEAYISYVQQCGRQKQEEFNCKVRGIPIEECPVPEIPFNHGLLGGQLSSTANKNLVAGTEPYHHGMQWNGAPTYRVVGYLGKGAFAQVYKLARRHDGATFAVKEIGRMALAKRGVVDRRVEQELSIMKRLQHPNIVQYIDHHESKDHIYIIMELVQHGDLQSYLNERQSRFQEYFCQAVASQMCQALKYLHDSKITHRDIKPDNILIASNDPCILKLSDFGLSKVVNEETFLKSFCGTLLYCAPEVYPGYDGHIKRDRRKRLRAHDGRYVPIK
ncbi:MAG: hypothetical protein Q9170_006395 [Blastenia crenularia]